MKTNSSSIQLLPVYYRVLKPTNTSTEEEDEDVARERTRVMSGNAKDDVLRIEELTKV